MPSPRLRSLISLSALVVALLVGCRREPTEPPEGEQAGAQGDAKGPKDGDARDPDAHEPDAGHDHGELGGDLGAELDAAPTGPRTREAQAAPQTRDAAMLADDGLHPSDAMYALWADAALPTALRLLRNETR